MRVEHTVVCWGFDNGGVLDTPDDPLLSVATGNSHVCGVRADQTLTCWGLSDYHDLESGSWVEVGKLDVPAGQFLSVAAGGYHSCGLRVDGTVACWGLNNEGQADAPAGLFGP